MPSRVWPLVLIFAFNAHASGQSAPAIQEAADGGWQLVYKHDGEGNSLGGDKLALVDAVRRGYDVRLAWGVAHPREPGRSVEHTALPIFLTIVDQEEVFVQVAEHVAHADYWAKDDQTFQSPEIVWSGILSTTGRFNATWYNRATGEVIRTLPQRVSTSWFVNYPSSRPEGPAEPLFAS